LIKFACKPYIEELASIFITVVDSNASAEDAYVQTNSEIGGEQRSVGAVLL
jgi:hypothetical protein